MKFHEILIKKREEKGLLKSEAADLMGWGAMYYGRFEKGQIFPSKNNIEKFSTFLEIDSKDLLEIIKKTKESLYEKLERKWKVLTWLA